MSTNVTGMPSRAADFRLATLYYLVTLLEDAGKTQLQKLIYFVQEAEGVPTEYNFEMHHYGPYAEDIDTDLTRLQLTGYININSDKEGYGFHVTVKEAPPPAWQFLVAAHQQNISQVTGIFEDYSASQLELAATIHFLNRLLGEPTDENLIIAVRRLKPKFPMSYISAYLNMLRKAGY